MFKAKTAFSYYISGDLFNDLKRISMSEAIDVPAKESFKPSKKVTEYSKFSRKKVYQKIVNHDGGVQISVTILLEYFFSFGNKY